MKNILLFLFNVSIAALTHAQNLEVIHSGTKNGFENKSYLVVQTLTLGPGFSVNAATNGTFFARAYQSANLNEPPSQNQNYVRTESILSGSITTEDQIANLNIGSKAVTYDYLDGLGRSSQSTMVQGSPLKRDIIQPFAYDTASRTEYEYLPYSYNASTGAFRTSALSEQSSFYTTTSKVSYDIKPWSKNGFEKSPLGRVKESYGPGDTWYGNSKKATSDFTIAGTSTPRWYINSSDLPQTSGNYPENLLTVTSTATEDGITVKEYADYHGLTVRKEVDASSPLVTLYVYDDLGNLRYILPPKISSISAPTQDQLNAWGFQFKYQYEYDATYGTPRLIKRKKQPGVLTDWVFEVYDEWGRLVASQDGVQRSKSPKEWTYVKYDAFNRPIVTGIFTSNNSPEDMAVAMSGDTHHEDENSTTVGYSLTSSFPRYAEFGSVTESNILSINYYDDYSFLSISGWDAESNSFSFSNPSGFSNTKLDPVKGQVTGTKTKNMASGTWLNAVVYYDNKYQPIQAIQENHLAGADRITYAYNFPGWTTKSYRQHTTSLASVNILEEYDYDQMGRLLKLFHTLDGGTRTLLAAYNYNEAGQVVETNLHSTDNGSSFLQSVDYRYNIRGWLTHINNSTLGVDGNNDDSNDLFGMQLVYNEETPPVSNGSGSGTTSVSSRYGGNISAIKWKTDNKKDLPKERIFGYTYDSKDRLTRGFYATKNGSNWSDDAGLFDEENITYDNNGNINTLRRYGKISGSKGKLDDLNYNGNGANSTGNELLTVEEVNGGNPNVGFVNGANGQFTEYVYDKNGNLESDMNSALTGVTYNYLNLPVTVTYNGATSSQTSVEFTYDASGYLLRKVYKRGTEIESQTDYVSGIQYYNNALGAVFTSEGRATKFNGNWEYEYYLKDHQENTRLVFGYLHDAASYKATMESYYAANEEGTFKKINATRWTNPAYNHTPKSSDVPIPDKSARLNGSVAGLEVGPGISLVISSGDKLRMEVYARYDPGSGSSSDVVTSLLGAATTSLNVTAGENAAAYGGFNTYMPNLVNGMVYNSSNPKAYINFILFDANYSNPQFGFKEISATSASKWEKLSLEVTVPNNYNGYAYIYLTNESNYNVYFDDMLVVHEKNTKSLHVTESADYYPFGLAIEGTHYVDQSRLLNSYGYQGDYSEFDARTGWNRFELRGNYDSRLGRWMSNDPYSQFSSPYNGMGNSPNNSIDPDGGFIAPVVYFIGTGAVIGGVTAGIIAMRNGANMQQTSLAVLGGAVVGGFVGYGLSLVNWSALFSNVPAAPPPATPSFSYSSVTVTESAKFAIGTAAQAADLSLTASISPGPRSGFPKRTDYPVGFFGDAWYKFDRFMTTQIPFTPNVMSMGSNIARGARILSRSRPVIRIMRSVGAGGKGFSQVLQKGGQAIKNSTWKRLGIDPIKGSDAIHGLKKANNLKPNFHGDVMGNGDYLHPETGEFIDNIFDYLH